MSRTIFAILGIGTALVLWKTSDEWLPKLQNFIENDIQPPKFEGIKQANFNEGTFNFTAILSFLNNSFLPVKVDNLAAKVFRNVKGEWKLIGQTRKEDQQAIDLKPNIETKFDVPLSVNVKDAFNHIINSLLNPNIDQFKADVEGEVVGIPFSISHQFTESDILKLA